MMDAAARILSVVGVVAGVLILAAVAHVTVISTGGYGTPQSWLTIAVAAGAAVGGICTGAAWSARRRALSTCFVIAIVAGEVFGFIRTGERLLADREAQQAEMHATQDAYVKATKRVKDAEAMLMQLDAADSGTSRRLADAIATKAVVDGASSI